MLKVVRLDKDTEEDYMKFVESHRDSLLFHTLKFILNFVDDHVDGHGEQPGPTPGGGAGRSENLQGGVQRKATTGNSLHVLRATQQIYANTDSKCQVNNRKE